MKRLLLFVAILVISFKAYSAVYTVNSNGDTNTGSGTSGTLRWCINQVNADAATPHTIAFNIASSGLQTITLTSALPTLTRSDVTIDGYTEPGAGQGPFGSRNITVMLDGSTAPVLYMFTILASNVLFRGFALKGGSATGGSFVSIGVRLGSANNFSNVRFQGNYINVSASGYAIPGYLPTSGAVHVYGNVSGGISTASQVYLGTDGDGINDDAEGNLAALVADNITSLFNFRDIDNSGMAGNWIGIAPDGVTLVNYQAASSNSANYPIFVSNCLNSVVGTNGDGVSDTWERNVIADGGVAILLTYNYTSGTNPNFSTQPLRAPGNNMVTGNYIGTTASGLVNVNRITAAGIQVRGIGNYIGCNTSGTTSDSLRNVIGAPSPCVLIYEIPHNNTTWNYVSNTIKGNLLGIGSDGVTSLGGGYGVVSYNSNNSVVQYNTVGNVTFDGIMVGKASASTYAPRGINISFNKVGLNTGGASASVGQDGIRIYTGTAGTIYRNIVTNSRVTGVSILTGSYAGYSTSTMTISQNSIYGNTGLGIDLKPAGAAGVTPNDGNKGISGSTTDPNLLIDYPVITVATLSGSNLTLKGFVGSALNQSQFANLTIELFKANNTPADQYGAVATGDGLSLAHGEGETYLGSSTTDANGHFSVTLDVTGKGLSCISGYTATATDAAGNTSEFGPERFMDFGDLPNAGTNPAAIVYRDCDGDHVPDAIGAVWAGSIVDYDEEIQQFSTDAKGDDNNATDDEDGLSFPLTPLVAGTTSTFTVKLNSNQNNKGVYYGLWFDWNGDGIFNDLDYVGNPAFYGNISPVVITTALTPVTVSVPVLVPSGASSVYNIRLIVSDSPVSNSMSTSLYANGEIEDYQAPVPLPVKLISFNGIAVNCQSKLTWKTAEEHGFDHFELQYSIDGQSFVTIGKLSGSANGNGAHYQYACSQPTHLGYYRLLLMDQDGSYIYSKVVIVRSNCSQNEIQVWPNLTQNTTSLSGLEEGESIQVYGPTGQLIISRPAKGEQETIDLGSYTSGIYQVTVSNSSGEKICIKKVIKQ